MLEDQDQELRTASSLRFVFTRRQKEVKTVEIKQGNAPQESEKIERKVPAPMKRRLETKKSEKAQDEVKRLKGEWGKAYRSVADNKDPTFPIFLEISNTEECVADTFYRKLFREMAYGSFPKGIFYDINRETMVCTEPPSKKNITTRNQRMEKFIRVCLPLRPILDGDNLTRNNTSTALDEGIQVDDENQIRRVLRHIQRCYQRLELPVLTLKDQFKLTLERIFQEIKLFIYIMIDILSPMDSVRLQQDSHQMILSGELTTSLRPPKAWKKLTGGEQVSLVCQYCRECYLRVEGKYIDQLTRSQTRTMYEIENHVSGLFMIGYIPASSINFNGYKIVEIRGMTIHSRGTRVDRELMMQGVECSLTEPDSVAPVVFQKCSVVGLQKISNGIAKQVSKFSKLVSDLTD